MTFVCNSCRIHRSEEERAVNTRVIEIEGDDNQGICCDCGDRLYLSNSMRVRSCYVPATKVWHCAVEYPGIPDSITQQGQTRIEAAARLEKMIRHIKEVELC